MTEIHSQMQAYIEMMPHLRMVFGDKVNLGVTDTEKCIWFDLSKGASSSKFMYKVGDVVPENSLPGIAIRTGRRTIKVIPKEVFSLAVVGVSIPIKVKGRVIGTVTISKILEPGRDRADEREMDFFRKVVLHGRVPEKYSYLPEINGGTGRNLINLNPLFGKDKAPTRPADRLIKDSDAEHGEKYLECDSIVYRSQAMQEVVSAIRRLSTSDVTVLIHGESGTGKELVAHAIHNQGQRRQSHFVAVNCAALPKELIQSELFGYDEGSFTGAKRGGKPGLFEQADNGTIFLDEIGDMDIGAQANLLRVLERKQVSRIGSGRTIPVNVRIIACTNKDLQTEVDRGFFRLDLFYRLKVVVVTVPPLRERNEDIQVLLRYFIKKYAPVFLGEERKIRISSAAETLLRSYSWPGNIREMENTIVSILSLLEGDVDVIDTEHLPQAIGRIGPAPMAHLPSLAEVEAKAIVAALAYCQNNISLTAQVLGITRPTLYRKITLYSLNVQ